MVTRGIVRTDQRTDYEARLDVDYAVSLSTMHCQIYRNIWRGIKILTAFLASATVVVLLQKRPEVSLALSIFTAALTAFSAVVDLSKLSDAHNIDRVAFERLRGKAGGMTVQLIDQSLSRIRATASSTLRGLEYPAYNDMLRRNGRPDYVRPLSAWEKLLDLLT